MSKALLGSLYRADIAAWIDQHDGPFSAQDLSDGAGIRYARVQQELKHLLGVGMLTLRENAGRMVLYEKSNSGYWPYCRALVDEWTTSVPAPKPGKPERSPSPRTRAKR